MPKKLRKRFAFPRTFRGMKALEKIWWYITRFLYNEIINREVCAGCKYCNSKYGDCSDKW